MSSLGDLQVGQIVAGSPRTFSRTDFVRYAGISGDFNPMHHDEVRARAAGEPSVFGHGMFSAGVLCSAVTELVGLAGLASYRVRFTRPVRPDEVVFTEIEVTASATDAEGAQRIGLGCRLRSPDGEDIVRGQARAVVAADPAATSPTEIEAALDVTDGVPALPERDAPDADIELKPGLTLVPARVQIEAGPVRIFAGVVGADEQLHGSAAVAGAAGFAGIPIPPTYGFVMGYWGAEPSPAQSETTPPGRLAGLAAVSDALAREGGMVLHGEQEFRYHRPIIVGETVDVSGTVVSVLDKVGSGGRALRFATVALQARGADGALALSQMMTLVCRR